MQNALFNYKHHPFLLYECRRSRILCNTNHQRILSAQQYQVDFYEQYQNKWARKQEQMVSGDNNKKYTLTTHVKIWCFAFRHPSGEAMTR